MAFVMVLSWSRQIFVRFYLNARMDAFLHGHVAAFEAWGGLPRVLLYDNLRSAVCQAARRHHRVQSLVARIWQHTTASNPGPLRWLEEMKKVELKEASVIFVRISSPPGSGL